MILIIKDKVHIYGTFF